MSYREKSAWLSLLITAYIVYYYLSSLIGAQQAQLLNEALLIDLFIDVIIITITYEVILQTILAIVEHKEADKSIDEREETFRLRAYRNAYHLLTAGVFIALALLWQNDFLGTTIGFTQLSAEFNTLNILLLGFLSAEVCFYASQLFYFRRGY